MWFLVDVGEGAERAAMWFDTAARASEWVAALVLPVPAQVQRLYTAEEARREIEARNQFEVRKHYNTWHAYEATSEDVDRTIAETREDAEDRRITTGVAISLAREDAQAISDNLSPQYLPQVVRELLKQIDDELEGLEPGAGDEP